MRRAEMEQHMRDGTSVGIKRSYGDPREAIIIEVPVTRRVYSSARWDFGGHTAHDGVRVRYVESGTEDVVGSRDVGDWEAMSSAAAARRTQAQERTDRLARQKAECEAQVARLGVGEVQARHSMGRTYGIIGWYVAMTPAQLAQLERKEDA